MALGTQISSTAQTNLQRQRKFQDKACSIDDRIEQEYSEVDWTRRNNAEIDLISWTKEYCVGLVLDENPSALGEEVLRKMEQAINTHSNFGIAMGRGEGKSCLSICTTLYALFTGRQKFVVLIANSARASAGILNDIWRAFQVPDSKLAHDYPELITPFIISNGSFKRRQLFKGTSTDISKTADRLILPTYSDSRFQRSSSSLVCCRSITGGIRGLRHHTQRPTMVILDDIQSSESARNPEQVQKMLDTINADIVPLAGKERISILQCFTQICPDDVVDRIKQDKSWNVTVFPSIIKYPTNMDLWNVYLDMYEQETATESGHDESLAFYKQNQYQMDEGSEVFNPTRYSEKDGYITAIQRFLVLRRQIGEANFDAEYQQHPHTLDFGIPITPAIVASRISHLGYLEVPKQNVVSVIASCDLNLSFAVTITIVVFMRDGTRHVIYHDFHKCGISSALPEQQYYKRVYDLLSEVCLKLKRISEQYKFNINAIAIDQNGSPWNAVADFCRNSIKICGIPACGFVGKASHQFKPFLKSRLKEECQRTLLCGDEEEHKVAGSGRRWVYHDTDIFHEQVQLGFLTSPGNVGSIMWYKGGEHGKAATQVCGEKLLVKRQRPDGLWEYSWKDMGSNWDMLDSLGQALAAFASMGHSTSDTGRLAMNVARAKFRKRVRII